MSGHIFDMICIHETTHFTCTVHETADTLGAAGFERLNIFEIHKHMYVFMDVIVISFHKFHRLHSLSDPFIQCSKFNMLLQHKADMMNFVCAARNMHSTV